MVRIGSLGVCAAIHAMADSRTAGGSENVPRHAATVVVLPRLALYTMSIGFTAYGLRTAAYVHMGLHMVCGTVRTGCISRRCRLRIPVPGTSFSARTISTSSSHLQMSAYMRIRVCSARAMSYAARAGRLAGHCELALPITCRAKIIASGATTIANLRLRGNL